MAVSVQDDLVLGAIKAADPAAREAALDRLKKAAALAPEPTAVNAARAVDKPGTWPVNRTTLGSIGAQPAGDATPAKGLEQFEAFFLKGLVEKMLPESKNGIFGGGLSGTYWRSMLADSLAAQIAKSGGVGIAGMIAGMAKKVFPVQQLSQQVDDKTQAVQPRRLTAKL